MKEKRPENGPDIVINKPRLSNSTRAFIQHAFALGLADNLDERRRWLVARYSVDDNLPYETVKKYAGVTTRERARVLWVTALETLWGKAPPEIQQKFSKQEIIRGKSTGRYGDKLSADIRKRIGAKVSEVLSGRKHTTEAKANMSVSQQERRKREKQINGSNPEEIFSSRKKE